MRICSLRLGFLGLNFSSGPVSRACFYRVAVCGISRRVKSVLRRNLPFY